MSRPASGSSAGGNHCIPHRASFRNSKDVTHGAVERTLEHLRAKEIAAASYISPRTRLRQRLAKCSAFKDSRPAFIAALAEHAVEETYQPDEVLFHIGSPCKFGTTPFYVVLEGQVSAENAVEVVLGFVYDGQIFGEGGAIGLTEERTVTIRASPSHLTKGRSTVVLRIDGHVLETALIACPEERDKLEENFYKHVKNNQDFEKRRQHWVMQTVVPALAGTALLAGCPDEFLYDVAAPLLERTYKDGQTIAVCGEAADSMLLVLEGSAEIEAKSGAKISFLREGATFGEVAALDLFPYRTATMKSVGRCRILKVTSKALARAIQDSSEDFVKMAFARLVQSRRDQVQKGLPMCALPIQAKPDDVAVRAVALQAERIDLAPGQTWVPLPDNDSNGPHFGILVKGRGVLETISEGRLVTGLNAGSLFPEGMAAEYHTHFKAVTQCEGYRVRHIDFLVAVYSMPSAQDWFYRFRLLDKNTREYLFTRLSGVRGVTQNIMEHPSDADIREWSTRRKKAVERAKVIKVQGADAVAGLPSMAKDISHTFLASTAGRAWRNDTRLTPADREPEGMSRAVSAPGLQQQHSTSRAGTANSSHMGGSLSTLQLPRLQTAS